MITNKGIQRDDTDYKKTDHFLYSKNNNSELIISLPFKTIFNNPIYSISFK